MTIYLTRDGRGTPYFAVNGGKTVITVKTAHRRFPELVGQKTVQAMEQLRMSKVVMVEVGK